MNRFFLKKYLLGLSFIGRAAFLSFVLTFSPDTDAQITSAFYSKEAQKLYDELLELNTKTDWTNLNSLVSEDMKNRYKIYEDEGDLWIEAKFYINEEFYDDQELWNNGIKVGTRINDEVKVKIPLFAYLTIESILAIEYVELEYEVSSND